ncbi:MAG: hypothetical protein WCO13_05670 [Bacteroidota bacterium]
MKKTLSQKREGDPKNRTALKNSLLITRYKDTNKFRTQEKIVFNSFFNKPQTMKEVEVITGIDRANICRYVKTFREQNKIAVLKVIYCSITKHRACKLTTNPELFPIDPQLKLF